MRSAPEHGLTGENRTVGVSLLLFVVSGLCCGVLLGLLASG